MFSIIKSTMLSAAILASFNFSSASTTALVAHWIQRSGSSSRLSSSRQESGEGRGESSWGLGMLFEDSPSSSRFSPDKVLDLLSEPSPEDLDPNMSMVFPAFSLPLILLVVLVLVEIELQEPRLFIVACRRLWVRDEISQM